MELIEKHKRLLQHPKYDDYIFCNDCGTLTRSDYREHKRIPVECGVKSVCPNGDTIIILKYNNELIFEEIHMDSLRVRQLIKISDFSHFFVNKRNITMDCILNFEYEEGKLLCTFKEERRRFTVMANLVTSDMKVVAQWNF